MTNINVNNLPDVLKGNALTLRRLALSDAQNFVDMFRDSDVARMTSTIPRYLPLIAAECKIMEMRAQERRGLSFNYAITQTVSGHFIGLISLFRADSDNIVEMDFHICKPSWNDAYVLSACQLILRAAQTYLGVRRVKADVFFDNQLSLTAFEKLGFEIEGSATHGFSMFRLEKVPNITLHLDLAQLDMAPAAPKLTHAKRSKAQLYVV